MGGAASVFDAFAATAASHPSHDFLHVPASATRSYADGALTYRYAEALGEVRMLADRFMDAGIGPGARVALLLENRPDYFFHWLALNALGASVVPINPDLRRPEIAYVLGHSEAILVVGLEERADDLRGAAKDCGSAARVVAPGEVRGGIGRAKDARAARPAGRQDECAVMYTSGTTGKPKGCLLSNDYFLRMGERYLNRRGHVQLEHGKSRILTPLPMFHMNAMAGSTMGAVMSASCLVQLDRFHPRTWWKDVAETRATGIHCLGVMPAILLDLPECPEERAHRVRYGTAANVEPQFHARFEARFGFPLIEGWAMTETGAGAVISADYEPRHVGTRCIGLPIPGVEVRIVDEQGADVAPRTGGELLVRRAGPNPRKGFFSGYQTDPAATEEAWRGGWWHTGDMATRWEDGTLHFLDRRKNVVRRSGENVSALEVESVLRGHPNVAAIAVTAVPDEVRGEEVIACVVPRAASGEREARAIHDWALERMAYFKTPGWIAFVAELPTTATQKIQRGALRELAAKLPGSGSCFDLRDLKRRARTASETKPSRELS
jgi:acyl-CoA synthetase (AMP-forming)/AMP-acid ligase II